MKKLPLGNKPSAKMLEDLHKSTNNERVPKPIIQKHYPGVKKKKYTPASYHYEHIKTLFEPPDEISIEDRIRDMEEYLWSLMDEESFN